MAKFVLVILDLGGLEPIYFIQIYPFAGVYGVKYLQILCDLER